MEGRRAAAVLVALLCPFAALADGPPHYSVPLGRTRGRLDGAAAPLPPQLGIGLTGRIARRPVDRQRRWPSRRAEAERAAAAHRNIPVTMLDVLVYVNVTVGTGAAAAAPLRVQVDTGSSSLALPGPECANCARRCPECVYDFASSPTGRLMPCDSFVCQAARSTRRSGCWAPTAGCAFRLGFADGSAAHGDIVTDTVSIGDLSAPDVAFARIWNETPAGGFSSLDVDGIIGFADRWLNRGGAREEMAHEAMLRRAGLPPMFSLSVGTHQSGTGVLTFGGIDPTRLDGQPTRWTPLLAGGWYVVQLNCVSIGGVPVSVNPEEFGDLTIVDSGTTMTLLPYTVMQSLKHVMKARWGHLPHVIAPHHFSLFNPGQCFSDIDPDVFPSVQYSFAGGAVVEVHPRQYFATAVQNNTTFYCFGLIGGELPSTWHVSDQQTILGDTFMAAAYVTFDRPHRRIGLSGSQVSYQPRGKCAAPPPAWALDAVSVARVEPPRMDAWRPTSVAAAAALLLVAAAIALRIRRSIVRTPLGDAPEPLLSGEERALLGTEP
eukprot:TRINITY_DN3769_c0_g1_i1.p1 TRINITY_DN3769_c0_g1~~TRINITY_DN3769_c0_g1_i1.p1  ORF type:complete len:547 (+),score=178.56 TRINITY_DN3769_c0_g1_i1:49-1689(+)